MDLYPKIEGALLHFSNTLQFFLFWDPHPFLAFTSLYGKKLLEKKKKTMKMKMLSLFNSMISEFLQTAHVNLPELVITRHECTFQF